MVSSSLFRQWTDSLICVKPLVRPNGEGQVVLGMISNREVCSPTFASPTNPRALDQNTVRLQSKIAL